MNSGILNTYLDDVGISTGNLKIWYSGFEGKSNTSSTPKSGIVYNILHHDGTKRADSETYNAYGGGPFENHTQYIPSVGWVPVSSLFDGVSLNLHGNLPLEKNGWFQPDDPQLVKIIDPVDFSSWTIFLDVSTNKEIIEGEIGDSPGQQLVKDKQKILVSSMYSPEYEVIDADGNVSVNQLSGFNIGINGANKLYLEYVPKYSLEKENEKIMETFSRPLSDRSLLSISMHHAASNLSFSIFRPNESYQEYHVAKPSKISHDWNIGGFESGSYGAPIPSSPIEAGFKNEDIGYSGLINHFMTFSPSLTPEQERKFSDFFFLADYESGGYKTRQTYTTKKKTVPKIGVGVVGTTIVGYEKILDHSIKNLDGATQNIYKSSPIMGDKTGQVVTYVETSEDVIGYDTYLAKEEKTFDLNDVFDYADKRLRFIKSVESGYDRTQSGFSPQGGFLYTSHDIHSDLIKDASNAYEIYTSKDPRNQVNLAPSYYSNSGMFLLGAEYIGGENQYINLYRNGILQKSGSYNEVVGIEDPNIPPHVTSENLNGFSRADFVILDTNKIWSNDVYKDGDVLIYDIVDEAPFYSGFINTPGVNTPSTPSIYGEYAFLDLPKLNLTGRDIYFGGIKLVSGASISALGDYYHDAGFTVVKVKNLDRGEFALIKQSPSQWGFTKGKGIYDNSYRQFGEADGDIEVISPLHGLTDEMVWLSGFRQARNRDYIKIESHSMLKSTYDFDSGANTFLLYSGESKFFNFWSGETINVGNIQTY